MLWYETLRFKWLHPVHKCLNLFQQLAGQYHIKCWSAKSRARAGTIGLSICRTPISLYSCNDSANFIVNASSPRILLALSQNNHFFLSKKTISLIVITIRPFSVHMLYQHDAMVCCKVKVGLRWEQYSEYRVWTCTQTMGLAHPDTAIWRVGTWEKGDGWYFA